MTRLLACALAVHLFPLAALAHEFPCMDRADAVKLLTSEKYQEQQRLTGIISPQVVMEFWHSEVTGTWTVLHTDADNMSCIVSAGEVLGMALKPVSGDPL